MSALILVEKVYSLAGYNLGVYHSFSTVKLTVAYVRTFK